MKQAGLRGIRGAARPTVAEMKNRILLAEPDCALRREFRDILSNDPEVEIVAEADTASKAITLLLRHNADVAILAADIPGASWIDVTTRIVSASPGTAVIVVSMNDDEHYVAQALRAGAREYVLKNEAADSLLSAIRRATRSSTSAA
jgi:DNA-binding NarL/FixJ family response regulator